MQYDPLYKRLLILQLAILFFLPAVIVLWYLLIACTSFFWGAVSIVGFFLAVGCGLNLCCHALFDSKEQLYHYDPCGDFTSGFSIDHLIFAIVLIFLFYLIPIVITFIYRLFVPLNPWTSFIPFVIKQKRLQQSS